MQNDSRTEAPNAGSARGLVYRSTVLGGIRMHRAFDALTGAAYELAQLHELGDTRPSLVCSGCPTRVVFSSGYWHARGKPAQRWIAPYIRLWPNSEHARDCKYTVAGAVNQLVAKSRAIEDLRDLFDDADGKVIFRLGGVHKAMMESKGAPTADPDNESSPTHIATAYRQRQPRIANYLRSATGIARLLALIESETELEQVLEIRTTTGRISWKDFFFEHKRLSVLYRRLMHKRQPITHPIAIEITVNQKKVDGPHEQSLQGIACHDDERRPDAEQRPADKQRPIVPWLKIFGQSLGQHFIEHETYVVLIQPRATYKDGWRNIRAEIHHRSQVAPLIQHEAASLRDDD